jgi:hypothetical protein
MTEFKQAYAYELDIEAAGYSIAKCLVRENCELITATHNELDLLD